MNETVSLREFGVDPWLVVIFNFVGYGAVLVAIRAICLKNADRWLGRSEAVQVASGGQRREGAGSRTDEENRG